MFSSEFINEISNKSGIRQRELIEKDLFLHKLLLALSSDENFRKSYAFKGGTCLIKCYLGYYRFSEDLDFTFINQDKLNCKSENRKRKEISKELAKVITIIDHFCRDNKLGFKPEKDNNKYFEFGGGNKFTTIKIYYDSIFIKENFIKLQFNFVEDLKFAVKEVIAESLLNQSGNKEMGILYTEYAELAETPLLNCYDIKEILCEKVRAILTRQGSKSRDFIDVYKITNEKSIRLESLKKEIIEKTRWMFRYEKYFENFLRHAKEIPEFKSGEEEYILVEPVSNEFSSFLINFDKFLKKISYSLRNRLRVKSKIDTPIQ